LLYYLDKQLTIRLQHARPDLLFLHAGVVALGGHAAVLVAPTGTGKSTLTLALVEAGFSYLSDELAPIDMQHMIVHPYAHALCLKSRPAAPYRWPAHDMIDARRFFVPVNRLPGAICTEPLPVAALIFLRRGPAEEVSHAISGATAAAHILANALNALAHPCNGFDAAVTLSENVSSFALNNSDLQAGCAGVRQALCGADPFRSATVREGLAISRLVRRAEMERRQDVDERSH
jgi:hypothetical protein